MRGWGVLAMALGCLLPPGTPEFTASTPTLLLPKRRHMINATLHKRGRQVAAQSAAEATLLTRWPVVNGRVRVAYTISTLTDSTITATLTQAMAHWSANACVDFVPATAADAGYVEVAAGAGTDCRATVGYGPGALPLWLTGTCSFGSIVHELGHVLGLYHEHSRWDRDRWVGFHAENVASGSSSEYAISGDSYAFGLYDYSSIMHYGPYAFWGGTGSTLFAPVVIGQRTGLTARDVALVRWLYNNCSSQPQAAIQCAANYDAFAYVVRPGRPFSLNIVGYYQPQALTLTFALPSGASANLASPYTAPASDSIVSLRVTWTPTSAQLGTHTVQATFSTSSGPSRACDFQVTVAASACDGHAGDPASDCSGHGRCTMASPAWPCECDVGHYGRLCEAAYMCPATLAETFDSGLGRFYAVAAGVAVAAGYLQMAQPSSSSAAYLTGISLTPAAVEVSVWVGPSIPASGIAASLLCGNPSYLTLAALQIQNRAFQAVAAGYAVPLSAVTPVANRWYTLRIAFDYQRRSFKYLIDGTFYLELSLDSSQTGTSAYLGLVVLQAQVSGTVVRFDNFKTDCARLTETPTPTPTRDPLRRTPTSDVTLTNTPTPVPKAFVSKCGGFVPFSASLDTGDDLAFFSSSIGSGCSFSTAYARSGAGSMLCSGSGVNGQALLAQSFTAVQVRYQTLVTNAASLTSGSRVILTSAQAEGAYAVLVQTYVRGGRIFMQHYTAASSSFYTCASSTVPNSYTWYDLRVQLDYIHGQTGFFVDSALVCIYTWPSVLRYSSMVIATGLQLVNTGPASDTYFDNVQVFCSAVAVPYFSPNTTRLRDGTVLTLASNTAGSHVCYTADGTAPSCSDDGAGCAAGTAYGTPLIKTAELNGRTLRAVACRALFLASGEAALTLDAVVVWTNSTTLTATATASATATDSLSPTATYRRHTHTRTATLSPTTTATHTRTMTSTTTTTPSCTPTATLSSTATVSVTATRTTVPTQTQTMSATATDTPTQTHFPTAVRTLSPSATPTRTASTTTTSSATATGSTTRTMSLSATRSPSMTLTGTGTSSGTTTPTASSLATATPTRTSSPTWTATATSSGTITTTVTASPSHTGASTPSPTPSATGSGTASVSRSPSPSRSGSPTTSCTASRSPSPTASSTSSTTTSITATVTATATPTCSRSPTRSPTASPTGTSTPLPTRSLTPTPTPAATPSPTASRSPSASPTRTATGSATASATRSATASLSTTQSVTRTATRSLSVSSTPTLHATASPTPSHTAQVTSSGTPTTTPSSSPLRTLSPTATLSRSASATPAPTPSPTASGTPSATLAPSGSPTASLTPSHSRTLSPTASVSPTPTPPPTPTQTASPTLTVSAPPTSTPTESASPLSTPTPSATESATSSSTGTQTPVPTGTPTPTLSRTSTATPHPTPSASGSPTPTRTGSPSGSHTPTATITGSDTLLLCRQPPPPVPNGTYAAGCVPTREAALCPVTCDAGFVATQAAVCHAGEWAAGECEPFFGVVGLTLQFPSSLDDRGVTYLLEAGCATLPVECSYELLQVDEGYVAPLRIGSATATTTPAALVATLARLQAPWAVFGRSATARWPARAWSTPTTVAGVVVGEGPAPAAAAVQNALLLAPGVPLPEAWGVTVAANAHGWQAAVTMTGVDNITAAAVNELAAVTLPDVLPAARRAGVAVDGAATTRLTAASVAPTGQAGPLVFLPDLAAVPTGGSALLFSGNTDGVCWAVAASAEEVAPTLICPCNSTGPITGLRAGDVITAVGCLAANTTGAPNATPATFRTLTVPPSTLFFSPAATAPASTSLNVAVVIAAAVAAGGTCLALGAGLAVGCAVRRRRADAAGRHAVDGRWRPAGAARRPRPGSGPSLGPVAPPPATALVEAEEGWWAAVRREGLWRGLDPRLYEVVVRAEDALLVRFLRAVGGNRLPSAAKGPRPSPSPPSATPCPPPPAPRTPPPRPTPHSPGPGSASPLHRRMVGPDCPAGNALALSPLHSLRYSAADAGATAGRAAAGPSPALTHTSGSPSPGSSPAGLAACPLSSPGKPPACGSGPPNPSFALPDRPPRPPTTLQ